MSDPAPQLKSPAPCLCGSKIPWHLVEVGVTSHTCMCGKQWSTVNEKTLKLKNADTGWRGVR